MSIDASKWVWRNSRASGGALLILLALADHANQDGEAWPSVPTMAKLVRLTERQVRKHIRKLLDLGEITGAGFGSKGVKRYRFSWRPPVVGFPPPLSWSSPPPCPRVHPTPVVEFTQTFIEPSLEPPLNRNGDFEAWWNQVPRKVGKGEARKAYAAALKKADAPTLLEGVMRYAAERASQDPKFTKHPASWLRAECWADDPAPRKPAPSRSVFEAIDGIGL